LGIVGVGPEEARLRALVKNLGLETRVSFLLTLDSQRDLWSLLRGSRVLLAPSVREGFGLVVAESLALGTPVVCALHPENESANLIGPMTGSITPPFDAEALADAAEFWLLDVSQRADRISVFIAEHGESVLDETSKSYAEIFRNLTTGLEPRE
jgi:glycosyltransferase involved in cell wall biosynthesis